MNIKVLLLTPKKLWFMSWGLLGLKHPFLGLFLMFVPNFIMYVAIVVFIVPNSNLYMSLHETSSFTFLERRQRPLWA